MQEETIKKIYKAYLENVLNIKYKKIIIKKESPLFDSKVCLASKDAIPITDYWDKIIELERGKYYLASSSVSDGVQKNTFFDSEGNIINQLDQFYIGKFEENIAVITSLETGLKGYINTQGKIISPAKWGRRSSDFKNGMARVTSTEKDTLGKSGFINIQGKLVIPCSSLDFYEFNDDVVCLNEGSLMKYYDKEGNMLFSSSLTSPTFQEGLVKYGNSNGKYGFKNKKGEIEIKARFDRVDNFSNGYAHLEGKTYIDLSGRKVKLVSHEYDSVKYEKGILKNIYYNSVTKKYDKFSCIPYEDLGDYLLCLKDNEYVIYSKATGVYTSTGINYDRSKKNIYTFQNLLCINNNLFYLQPQGCINLSDVISIPDMISYNENSNIMDYETFKVNILKDKDFYDRIIAENEQAKAKKIRQTIIKVKESQDKKRQELIEQMKNLTEQLDSLNASAGSLSQIDGSLLLTKVDDHFEIKKEFIKHLSYLDLSYIDFTNVKVSGVDFSGTNADLDPQRVYNKDMSNSNYKGLNFTSKNFNGVNIKGSNFTECIMDFALLDGAIKDENTKFTEAKKY